MLRFLFLLFTLINLSFTSATAEVGKDFYYYDNDIDDDLNNEDFASEQTISDPFEGINRGVFGFNQILDLVVLEPTSQIYSFITPDPLQDNVRNFYYNLGTPLTAINQLLQGDPVGAGTSLMRFVTNTLLGFGGLVDIASEFDMPYHSGDFGQTLGYYGAGEGPYLVFPVFGSSNYRDALGRGGDYYLDPINKLFIHKSNYIVLSGGKLIQMRADNKDLINSIRNTSVDPYTTMKSLYTQNRRNKIRNQGNSGEKK